MHACKHECMYMCVCVYVSKKNVTMALKVIPQQEFKKCFQ